MAELKHKAAVSLTSTLTLNEKELMALDALAGYGTEPFLEVFYKHMGRHYLQPHEEGLRSLFNTVRGCGSVVSAVSKARGQLVIHNVVGG